MSYTALTTYTRVLNASLYEPGGNNALLNRLAGSYVWSADGVGVLPIASAFSASATITDGTLATNGLSNTTANWTFSDAWDAISLTPTQWDNLFTSPANQAKLALAMSDACVRYGLDVYIAALVAASPTYSNSLATGKTNFAAATSTELGVLAKTIVGAAAGRNGSYMDYNVIMQNDAFANLSVAGATLITHGLTLSNPAAAAMGAVMTFMGVPIYGYNTSSTSHWGQASDSCAFVVHPDGAPFVMSNPYIHGNTGGYENVLDGTRKLMLMRPFKYSIAQVALTGEIKNPAS